MQMRANRQRVLQVLYLQELRQGFLRVLWE
jgi:hypothetical protein